MLPLEVAFKDINTGKLIRSVVEEALLKVIFLLFSHELLNQPGGKPMSDHPTDVEVDTCSLKAWVDVAIPLAPTSRFIRSLIGLLVLVIVLVAETPPKEPAGCK